MHPALTASAIANVAETIAPYIRRTPVVAADLADFGLPAHPVQMKLELLQHAGSFKARGAFANLLTRDVPDAGVVAASGGNHGAAVAYAAQRLGMPAHIFVPTISSPAKLERIRGFGAAVYVVGERYADALAESETFAVGNGALQVHAFEQIETLLGQGTLGREIEEDYPDIDTLLVAVGGGGLIGGIAAWFAGRVRIVAVEPEGSPTLFDAFTAGRPVDSRTEGIAADSLAPKRVGELMFPLAQAYVQQPVLVSDDDIRAAQRALWNGLRVVAEPGGAAAFAALLSGKYRPAPDEKIAVLVCGGNTTAVSFQ
jgi:threonine dehydratase